MIKKNITWLDVWNIDKNDFMISFGIVQLVATFDSNKSFKIINSINRDYIISVVFISFYIEKISPILFISRMGIIYK